MKSCPAGKLIHEEVKTYNDAVLLLWRVHNKANQRLSGDISEDPVFPKLVFPSKDYCSSCYNPTVTGIVYKNSLCKTFAILVFRNKSVGGVQQEPSSTVSQELIQQRKVKLAGKESKLLVQFQQIIFLGSYWSLHRGWPCSGSCSCSSD